MKLAYIVLHYLATKETVECVESILKNVKSEDTHKNWVIVVDNGSSNGSFVELETAFCSYSMVKLIKSEENLGFAKGNNLGFHYAKHQLKTDFIILLNNDTLICQTDFTDIIVKKFQERQYSVLGPDIIAADYHQNPGNKQSWSLPELRRYRLKKRIRLLLNYLHFDTTLKVIEPIKKVYRSETLQGDINNTILHGACLIFSPLFVKKFEGLYDGTFLYMEEDILKLYSDYYDFLMLYTSELRILHKEDIATNMIQTSDDKKIRLKYKRLIKSSKIYSTLKRRLSSKKRVINIIERIISKEKTGEHKYKIDLDIPLSYLIIMVWQRCIMLMRGKCRSIGMKRSPKKLFIGKNVVLKCKYKMQLGNGVTIHNGVYLDALSRTGIVLEDGSSIGSNTLIKCTGNVRELGQGFYLGKCSSLADNCFVGATGGVHIGDDVIGGQNIRFHSSNHNFNDKNRKIREQGVTALGITVGNNCWIGAGVTFCDGVTIGNACVIGANAVVTKNFPDNCVIVGNPARIIRKRE